MCVISKLTGRRAAVGQARCTGFAGNSPRNTLEREETGYIKKKMAPLSLGEQKRPHYLETLLAPGGKAQRNSYRRSVANFKRQQRQHTSFSFKIRAVYVFSVRTYF